MNPSSNANPFLNSIKAKRVENGENDFFYISILIIYFSFLEGFENLTQCDGLVVCVLVEEL